MRPKVSKFKWFIVLTRIKIKYRFKTLFLWIKRLFVKHTPMTVEEMIKLFKKGLDKRTPSTTPTKLDSIVDIHIFTKDDTIDIYTADGQIYKITIGFLQKEIARERTADAREDTFYYSHRELPKGYAEAREMYLIEYNHGSM